MLTETGKLGASWPVEKLIEEARGGSTTALGELVESCRRYLLLVANRELSPGLQSKVGPSDVVQDTFLEAHRDFGRFHGHSEAELLAWLRRILRNNLSNQSRHYQEASKRRIDREVSMGAKGGGADDVADRNLSPVRVAILHEQGQTLDRAMRRLPSHYRQMLIWRHWEDRSFEEISLLCGRSPDASRMLWWRAFERLTRELRSLSGGDLETDSGH